MWPIKRIIQLADDGMTIHPLEVIDIQKLGERIAERLDQEMSKTDDEYTEEVLRREWYVLRNDVIGGWCITTLNIAPSQRDAERDRYYYVSDMVMTREIAEHVVAAHNRELLAVLVDTSSWPERVSVATSDLRVRRVEHEVVEWEASFCSEDDIRPEEGEG